MTLLQKASRTSPVSLFIFYVHLFVDCRFIHTLFHTLNIYTPKLCSLHIMFYIKVLCHCPKCHVKTIILLIIGWPPSQCCYRCNFGQLKKGRMGSDRDEDNLILKGLYLGNCFGKMNVTEECFLLTHTTLITNVLYLLSRLSLNASTERKKRRKRTTKTLGLWVWNYARYASWSTLYKNKLSWHMLLCSYVFIKMYG